MSTMLCVLIGFLMDCILGDPERLWHPICGIGKLISVLETCLRGLLPKTPRWEVFGGGVMWVLTVAASFAVPWGILWLCGQVHPVLAFAVQCIFCWQIFAAKSLAQASMRVYRALRKSDLNEARKYVSWIVGRDTAELSAEQVTKAAVETVAENASDGVIAPLLYMVIGGAPLAFAYKAVNTMDSMTGYKNDTYYYFGRIPAKLDDVFNWIPARLTGLLFVLCARMAGLSRKGAWKIYRRDRHNHSSPNAAHPESACAGALGVQLAGNAYYFGKLYEKPTIGDALRPIEPQDIPRANRLMQVSAAVGVLICCAVRLIAEGLLW